MASTTSTPAVNSPTLPQAPVEKPSAPPINILPSQLARIYSFVHPALLLTLGASRFEAVVANPVQELLKDLPWLALLQLFYVILCVPPAGSTEAASIENEDKKKAAPRSPSGPTGTLRPGKPGYRRKHSSGKSVWAGIWAKLMVSITEPSPRGMQAYRCIRADNLCPARVPLSHSHLPSRYPDPGRSPGLVRCSPYYTQRGNLTLRGPHGTPLRDRAGLRPRRGKFGLE